MKLTGLTCFQLLIPVENPPLQLQSILQVLNFCKWTGFLPLTTTQEADKAYKVILAGFLHILICIFTITLQIVFGLEFAKRLFTDRIRMTDILISVGHYASSFCLVIIIPRIVIMSKSSLETALNTLSQATTLLDCVKRAKSRWPPWLPLLFMCSFMVLIDFVRVFYFRTKDYAILNSSTVTLGTGHTIVGSVIYGLDAFYNHLATWILLLQYFVICRTVVNCLTCFRQKIQEEVQSSPSKLERSPQVLSLHGRVENLQDITLSLSKAINAVDSYFGFSLLLFITCRLIGILSNLHLFSPKSSPVAGMSVSQAIYLTISVRHIVTHITELLFIIWLADSLSTAVEKLKQEVLNVKCPCLCPNLDGSHIQWLQNRVVAMKGDITAFGLFPINRRIILPILGAVVTYFMIIVQFAKDERTSSPANSTCTYV